MMKRSISFCMIALLLVFAWGIQGAAREKANQSASPEYVRDDLKFGEDKSYKVLPEEPGQTWDWKHKSGQGSFFPGPPSVEWDLVRLLIENPSLRVQVENGIFDMATPFFATEYTMDHLFLPEKTRDRIRIVQIHNRMC